MKYIYERLKTQRRPNCSVLAEALEVSPKTIQRDIDFMRYQLDLPIEYDQVQHGFFFNGQVAQFPSIHITEAELIALLVARKALEHIEPGSIEKAGMLLEKLYQMLCYACDFVLFSAYDPFQSVGISQTAFLDAVLGLKAEHLELHKFIDHGLHLVRDSRLNRYTLGSNLVQVLIDRLRTPESLELAIERAAHLHSETNSGPERKQNYERADRRNRLAEFGFLAYVKLSDYDRAIDFFLARYIASDKEISLFVLLERLRALQREDLWQREYERAIQTGIRPRDRLADAYRHLKSHGQLPAYY